MAEGTVVVPPDSTGKAMRTQTNAGVSAGAHQPVHTQAGPDGTLVSSRPDGFLNIREDPTTLLFDTFETLDTGSTWTLSGTVPPTLTAAGVVSASAGTAAGATSIARSQPSFVPGTSAYLQYASVIQIDAAAITGTTRWWGLAVPAAAPTTGVPVSNGVVFETDAANGGLYGRVYSGGARTQEVALTRPGDGAYHRYQVLYRTSRVFFNIDGIEVGSLAFPNPAVNALPTSFGTINGGAALAAAPVLNDSLVGVGDTARGAIRMADGQYAWRWAGVTDNVVIPNALTRALREQHAGPALNVNPNALQKAVYRAAAKPTAAASTASTFQPRVSIHHPATSTKTVRIHRISVFGISTAVAGWALAEVHRITAAPSGTVVSGAATANQGVLPNDSRDPAAEAVITNTVTAATSAGLVGSGFLGGNASAVTSAGGVEVCHWEPGAEEKAFTLRAGVLEGFVVGINTSAAMTWTLTIEIVFTEE